MSQQPRTTTTMTWMSGAGLGLKGVLAGQGWLLLAATALLAFLLSTAVYRLYFHPLAKYPGPFWARLTSIPMWWHTRKQERHLWLWQLQQEYGTTFRYTPNSLVINTPAAYKTIFGPRGNVKKGQFYRFWPLAPDNVNTWDTTDVALHARKRRVLSHAFSERALRSAEPFVLANIDRWCDLLEQEIDKAEEEEEREGEKAGKGGGGGIWSKPQNMTDWLNYLVFDILGDLCFGRSFDMKEHDSKIRHIPDTMMGYIALMYPLSHSPIADLWIWLKPRGLDRLFKATMPATARDWHDFVEGSLRWRAQREEEDAARQRADPDGVGAGDRRRDFFHYLFNATDPATGGPGYSEQELLGECELLISAGGDTTSTVMASLLFYLSRDPGIQSRLAREVRSRFATAADIRSGTRLASCSYLRAFIQEGLRMTPPAAAELPREVLKGGTTVDGEWFPEGVGLSVALYCLSHSGEVYADPLAFAPERWLVPSEEDGGEGEEGEEDEEKKEEKKKQRQRQEDALCAFSTGSRGCIGKSLAWLEMSVAVAKLVHRFELRRGDGGGGNLGGGDEGCAEGPRAAHHFQIGDIFLAHRQGPSVQLRKRVEEDNGGGAA